MLSDSTNSPLSQCDPGTLASVKLPLTNKNNLSSLLPQGSIFKKYTPTWNPGMLFLGYIK